MACVLVVASGAVRAQSSGILDRDLTEVSVPKLETLYAAHQYTVTRVTEWYLDRIARYDGTYKALLHVDRGTDTSNSIRQPAANNSLVGFMPTRGLTSIAGIDPAG